jgi:glycosyltransferase involved in cell wall biosynthesis
MIVELNTDFSVPIWRFFMLGKYDIPYTLEVNGKEFRNGICIIQIGCFVDEDVCLANQNAFIDETLYNIDYTQTVSYDLFVSSQFISCKNLHLLHDIDNVCGAGYYGCPETSADHVPFPSSVKKVLNFEDGVDRVQKNCQWVSPKDIVKAINSSKIGGIFSTHEGACFSSSEYLLCGIPVLSCKAKGGREISYNEDNCELCDPDNSSIREALGRMLSKYDKGEYDREAIRNRHIELMGVHRKNLGDAILDVMKKIVHTDELPSVEEIVESVKYYHSNNRCYEYTHGYKRQTKRQWDAKRVLHPTV